MSSTIFDTEERTFFYFFSNIFNKICSIQLLKLK